MLRICVPHQQESSFCHTNTKPDTSYIFSQTESPRRIDAWPRYGSVGVICLFQKQNDALPSSGTAARFGIHAVANLHSYPLSCTDAIIGILAFSAFSKSTTAQYAQWGHRTSNFTITILRFNRFSYTAASMSVEEGV